MKYSQAGLGRIFVIRLEDGDIVHEEIEKFAREKKISAASLIVLGGADAKSVLVTGPEQGRAKKIVPKSEVIMPNGISPGRSVRAMLSQKITKIPPVKIEPGSVKRASAPKIRLAAFGISNPTHQTIPLTDITAAVDIAAAARRMILSLAGKTPREDADSSLKESSVSLQRILYMINKERITTGVIKRTSFQVVPHNPPNIQNVISGSSLKGSEIYFSKPIPAVKSAEIVIPESIRRSTHPPNLILLAIVYDNNNPNPANNAAVP